MILGFTGILLCNLMGVAAQLCQLDTAGSRIGRPVYILDWGKTANHVKLYMIHSWIGLLMAVLVIVYLARENFSDDDIPLWVQFILMNRW
jgi:hypothetical protein